MKEKIEVDGDKPVKVDAVAAAAVRAWWEYWGKGKKNIYFVIDITLGCHYGSRWFHTVTN